MSKILVVEDEALIAMDLARRLEALGHEVIGTADNRDDAVSLADGCTPELVLMDINIIGPADGIETAKELRSRWDIPVVFLTAFGDDATVERAKQVTPYGYLLKPFDERTLATTLEVTLHRHRADKQMHLLSTAVDAASNGIIVADALDEQRAIIYCNHAFATMTGYSTEEILGNPACFLASRSSPGDALPRLRAALAARSALETVVVAQHKDGTSFWSALSLSPVADATGKITHLLLFHVDISARRRAEAALAEAQKLEVVGSLTAGVAHDFNNVLGAVRAFAELAQHDLGPDDTRREDLDEVIRASERGAALTPQLLSFVHRGSGVQRHVDMNKVLQRSSKMLQRLVGTAVRLDVRASAQALVVLADPISIEHVLLNLAANARDAINGAGALSFSLQYIEGDDSRQAARLVVSDSGSGMSAATCAKIFEPFFTTKPLGAGTGLGLATSKAIIDRLGGTISVTSTVGEGTVFTIDLPLSGEEDSAVEPKHETTDLGDAGGAVVLLAEENAALREASSRALTQVGFEVVVAADGEQAIGRITDLGTAIKLVISDVVLPGRGGNDVIAHANQTVPRAGILLIAGYLDHQHPLAANAPSILWKPFSMRSLARRALEAFARPEPESNAPPPTEQPVGPNVPPEPPSSRRYLRADPRSVLLVEDDEQLSEALARTLRRTGYDVVSVGTGDAAITRLDGGKFDLIVTDIDLPGATGIDVLTAARADSRQTPVLLMTGVPSVETVRAAVRDNAASYLVKPFSPQDFATEIDGIMAEVEISKLRRHLEATRQRGDKKAAPATTSERRFEAALDSLYVVYQPIVRAHDGSLFAFEALMRTRTPTLFTPSQLLAAAEGVRRIKDLGRVVRSTIADTIDRHSERTESLFINLHPSEVSSALLSAADEPLRRHASRIVLEVAEPATISHEDTLTQQLNPLRQSGYRLAVDDLGAGYAGISSLVKLKPEYAKLDMSLVRDIHESKVKQEIVHSLITVCRRSSITVVAEGVEVMQEAQVLADLGCDLLQGYFFGRPGPAFPEIATNQPTGRAHRDR